MSSSINEIPPFEIQYARFWIKTRSLLFNEQKLLEQFKIETDELLRIYDQDESYDVFRPYPIPRITGLSDSARRWSIAMILEFLTLVVSDYIRIVESLNRGVAPKGMFELDLYQPNASVGPEIRELYVESIEVYIQLINSQLQHVGRLDTSTYFSHGWYGQLNARQWNASAPFQASVCRRHAQKVIALMGVA